MPSIIHEVGGLAGYTDELSEEDKKKLLKELEEEEENK